LIGNHNVLCQFQFLKHRRVLEAEEFLLIRTVSLLFALGACTAPPTTRSDAGESPKVDAGPVLGPRPTPPPTFREASATRRIVAIGDVHGDLGSARDALRVAGLIDSANRWSGGTTLAVQVGDQLDRGDDERAILDWFELLADQAWAAGGGFYPLIGNHETMNVAWDFRYVTAGGWRDFADVTSAPSTPSTAGFPADQRGRAAAFTPGGPYASILAGHNTIMVIGDTVFVHGGVLTGHVQTGLDRINGGIQAWMAGKTAPPTVISSDESPVWSRHYSDDPDSGDCDLLAATLRAIPARRMVVAHTVQTEGINAACNGMVYRVDVGLSDYYGGTTEALEIVGDTVTVLR
jgi:hypothetical protein